MLNAARGDVAGALGVLRKVAGEPGSECPFEGARSRLALGQVYRRAGYKSMASEVLNAAAAAFEEMGIPRWADRARHEAGRVGLHPTTVVEVAASHCVYVSRPAPVADLIKQAAQGAAAY